MRRQGCFALALVLVVTISDRAFAGWIDMPGVNLPVCTSIGEQLNAAVVADGAGGAIVAWIDNRSGQYDIYAQHVLVSGTVDPAWPPNGRALCTSANDQINPAIVSDGAGGAILTWQDARNPAGQKIFAQHVLATGSIDSAWPLNGRALSNGTYAQYNASSLSDGTGGAFVAWQDYRNGSNFDIYASHVLGNGTTDPAWPADGLPICTAPGYQQFPKFTADGSGGALLCWQDDRGGSGSDIYAQHILVSGVADPGWPAGGSSIVSAVRMQENPILVGDGLGGAIITWQDYRNGDNYDVYAQRVLASGGLAPGWPSSGLAVSTAPSHQMVTTIVGDGASGAIVAWFDWYNGAISAQHVLSTGAIDPAWPADGCGIRGASGDQTKPLAVTDGAGGALVSWQDNHFGAGYDVYAQHVLASGIPDATWPFDGRALCTASADQLNPSIASDGMGGAIVAWQDRRSGIAFDVYAQRITADGHLGDVSPSPAIAGARDTPNDQGGRIKLTWKASPLDAAPYSLVSDYRIWRSVPPQLVESEISSGARLVRPGGSIGLDGAPSLRATQTASGIIYWEFVATQDARRFAGYSLVVNTISDSVGGSNPYTLFLVEARGGGNSWDSAPDSGYSVDDLSPIQPSPFAAVATVGGVALHWGSNREPDFFGYMVYRGSDPSFVPSPATLVGAKPDTGYFDPVGSGGAYYKLAAVDIHGNVSPFAIGSPDRPTSTLMSLANLDIASGSVRLTWLAPAYPGIEWTLQRKAHGTEWVAIGVADADPDGVVAFVDMGVHSGEQFVYRVRGVISGQEFFSAEVAATIPLAAFALEQVAPNPASGGDMTVGFTLPDNTRARLELFDIAGRLVESREVGSLGAGRHAVQLAAMPRHSGIHFVRLTQGSRTAQNRVAIIQ